MKSFYGEIIITRHAKDRFLQRWVNLNRRNRNINVNKKMVNMIIRSRLMKSLTKENGEVHEYRECNGCIFVCAREFSKVFWKKDKVTIITVELMNWYIIKKINSGTEIDMLDLNEYSKTKVA